MEYYSTIRRNEVLIHATTWMNFENMLSNRSQTQKATYYYCIISFIRYIQNRQLNGNRHLLSGYYPGMGYRGYLREKTGAKGYDCRA